MQVTLSEARDKKKVKHLAEDAHHNLGDFLPNPYHLITKITVSYEVNVRGYVVKY